MTHKHKCPKCDRVWHHDSNLIETSEQNNVAHTCPAEGCRGEHWSWYEGSIESSGLHDGLTIEQRGLCRPGEKMSGAPDTPGMSAYQIFRDLFNNELPTR